MAKDESIVKSFRIAEDQFDQANDIFQREGFSVSEVIRILFEATIREGRIPRGLSTREMEPELDDAKAREQYIDEVLAMAGIRKENPDGSSPEQRVLDLIFHKHVKSDDMPSRLVREWAKQWGLPDSLSLATLCELHDCGLFPEDPWYGDYNADISPTDACGGTDEHLADAMIMMEFQNNLADHLEQVKRKLQIKAVKYLMEMSNKKEEEE